MRSRTATLLCTAAVLAALALAGALSGAAAPAAGATTLPSNALGGFTEAESQAAAESAENTVRRGTGTAASTSGSSATILIVVIVAGALLVGIAVLIVKDARKVAPAPQIGADERLSEARAVQMRKRRAKAKAARQQRKRNR